MECTNCSFFKCVDKETNSWQCGDPQSWYNPKTANTEVCRYQDGAVQRDSNNPTVPLSVVEEVLRGVIELEYLSPNPTESIIEKIKQKADLP